MDKHTGKILHVLSIEGLSFLCVVELRIMNIFSDLLNYLLIA